MKQYHLALGFLALMVGCKDASVPVIAPDVITERTLNDTDDPAIWVNPKNPTESIVFGTDKKTNGGVYAFGLDGKIIAQKSITNIKRPNNVDVEYGFKLNDSTTTDILAFTEREKQQIRVFSVPDMKPLDGGGFPVFTDEPQLENRLPMGIALYKSPKDQKIYAIVGRKTGPAKGYLYQYALQADSVGVMAHLVRKFGSFSGKKEIEAIAVDDAAGLVYYSDEGVCIKKYAADPNAGDVELACFGGDKFAEDIEGIALANYPNGKGYIIVSDQQRGRFNVFSKADNTFIKALDLTTQETDGCDAVTVPMGPAFPHGLFAAMNNGRNFYFYDLDRLGLEQ